MPLDNHPYQKCLENDLSEEIEEFQNEEQNLILNQPKDSYYIVYVTLCILGITSIMPQTFFIVANEYWMYKFKDVTNNSTDNLDPLQASYTSCVTVAASVPFTIFCIVNVVVNEKVSLHKRILGCLTIMFILFLITLVFVQINTNSWQNGFLAVTLLTVAVLSASSAMFTSIMAGVISKFSPQYITSFILGQGLTGTFSSLAEIISLSIGASPTSNGQIYFVIGLLTILIAFTLYMLLQKNLYFTTILLRKNEIGINEFESDLIGPPKISYKLIFKKTWHYLLSSFIGMTVTTSLSPGVSILIKSYGTGKWSDLYFIPVTTILIPNIVDCCGRILSGWTEWPRNRNLLIILNLVRLCMIPIILFCNLQPRGSLPVFFDDDAYYIVFVAILSFSHGYIFNICVINVPKVVEHHEKHTAGLMITIFIALGSNVGSLVSVLFVEII